MVKAQPLLIGLDWGTSSLRAYLLGDGGAILAQRTEPWGVMAARGADFAAAFAAIVAPWDRDYPGLPAIAAGMIGSTEGWVRAPYCRCPAGLAELAAALVTVPVARAGPLRVIPGVESGGAEPNVMRGEETQIIGALTLAPELQAGAIVVLPGTHAKWVELRDGRIVRFDTYMTGELYALLAEHSILGRPARAARPAGGADWPAPGVRDAAFDRGVALARDSGARGAAPLLFLTRSLVLGGALAAATSLDFLSGLLIGEELRSALQQERQRIALVGDVALCVRYRRALEAFGVSGVTLVDATAPAGLWRIAASAQP